MIKRIYIHPYNMASGSALLLSRALGWRRMRSEGPPIQNALIFNWGASQIKRKLVNCQVINVPAHVREAQNKLETFLALEKAGVPIVPFTTDTAVAARWLNEKGHSGVIGRTVLSGHSGQGITYYKNAKDFAKLLSKEVGKQSPPEEWDVPDEDDDEDGHFLADNGREHADGSPRGIPKLYTKYIKKDGGEWRVHVVDGAIIDFAQKVRKSDAPPEKTELERRVRSHNNGWIYARESRKLPDYAKEPALAAVKALGLDFGAVDIICHDNKAFVLEVNTAPGVVATSVENYSKALRRVAAKYSK